MNGDNSNFLKLVAHGQEQLLSPQANKSPEAKHVKFAPTRGADRQKSNAANGQTHSSAPAESLSTIVSPNGINSNTIESTNPQETYFAAFPPGTSPHPSPYVSYGLPFPQACAKHIAETFRATRVYILVSKSLSENTDDLARLHVAIDGRLGHAAIDGRLGEDTVVGIRRGVKPHTFYSDIIKIAQEVRDANANCLVTLGGGSLTDAAKVVVFVSLPKQQLDTNQKAYHPP